MVGAVWIIVAIIYSQHKKRENNILNQINKIEIWIEFRITQHIIISIDNRKTFHYQAIMIFHGDPNLKDVNHPIIYTTHYIDENFVYKLIFVLNSLLEIMLCVMFWWA